jgi:hypothetical protein
VDRFEKGANEMEKTCLDPGTTLMTHLRICARPGGGRLPPSVCILTQAAISLSTQGPGWETDGIKIRRS